MVLKSTDMVCSCLGTSGKPKHRSWNPTRLRLPVPVCRNLLNVGTVSINSEESPVEIQPTIVLEDASRVGSSVHAFSDLMPVMLWTTEAPFGLEGSGSLTDIDLMPLVRVTESAGTRHCHLLLSRRTAVWAANSRRRSRGSFS